MKQLNWFRTRLVRACSVVRRRVHNLWRRLLDEPGYADAAADLAVCGVVFCCKNPRIIQVTQTVAAMLRNIVRNHPVEGDPTWELPWA